MQQGSKDCNATCSRTASLFELQEKRESKTASSSLKSHYHTDPSIHRVGTFRLTECTRRRSRKALNEVEFDHVAPLQHWLCGIRQAELLAVRVYLARCHQKGPFEQVCSSWHCCYGGYGGSEHSGHLSRCWLAACTCSAAPACAPPPLHQALVACWVERHVSSTVYVATIGCLTTFTIMGLLKKGCGAV